MISNAIDAMPTGGRITIQTHNAILSELQGRRHSDPSPGLYTVLTVSDTGTGMDEATKARIFEPFFTTKEFGKGTGLGLAMIHGMVEQSGGRFLLKSNKGEGTTAEIWLPAAIAEVQADVVKAETETTTPEVA